MAGFTCRDRTSAAEGKSVSVAPSEPAAFARSLGGSSPAPVPFGWSDLFTVCRERFVLVRNVAIVFVVVTLFVVFFLPSIYTASAVVVLDPHRSNIIGPSSVLPAQSVDPALVQDQIQILTS